MHEKLKNKRWISKVSISFQTIVNLYWRYTVTASIFSNFCSKIFGSKIPRFGWVIGNVQSVRFFNNLTASPLIHTVWWCCVSRIFYWFFGYAIQSASLHSSLNPCMHLIAWKWFSAPLRFRDHFSKWRGSSCISIIKSKSVSSIRLDVV